MAMLGEALVKFSTGDFSTALRVFKKVLVADPQIQLPLRFVIGVCYYRLENFEKAELAFDRQL